MKFYSKVKETWKKKKNPGSTRMLGLVYLLGTKTCDLNFFLQMPNDDFLLWHSCLVSWGPCCPQWHIPVLPLVTSLLHPAPLRSPNFPFLGCKSTFFALLSPFLLVPNTELFPCTSTLPLLVRFQGSCTLQRLLLAQKLRKGVCYSNLSPLQELLVKACCTLVGLWGIVLA